MEGAGLALNVPAIVAAYDLGSSGRLSNGPVAQGRLGWIWRLDTDSGSWAVKRVEAADDNELREIEDGARFQERALAAGVATPTVRRTRDGDLIATIDGARVRVHAWVDLDAPQLDLDAERLGGLVAALHLIEFEGSTGVHPWYTEPVGASRWRELVALLRESRAPFVDELEALIPGLIELERHLGGPPRTLRTCHRDLWADNVRSTRDGTLCVFDFDNAGLADPAQELALVLVEFAGNDPARAREIQEAYADAGGPGTIAGPGDFAMVIAQLSHIVEEGCRRWLASTDDEARDDNEGWVREFIDRPLTPAVIERLLEG
jgi:Ser/Thr protein kinase RdoA (MazF antagonist)